MVAMALTNKIDLARCVGGAKGSITLYKYYLIKDSPLTLAHSSKSCGEKEAQIAAENNTLRLGTFVTRANLLCKINDMMTIKMVSKVLSNRQWKVILNEGGGCDRNCPVAKKQTSFYCFSINNISINLTYSRLANYIIIKFKCVYYGALAGRLTSICGTPSKLIFINSS